MDGSPVTCKFCKEIPTSHQCMYPVSKGGIILDGVGGQVCGEWICAPCSSAFGNEVGIFRCLDHTTNSSATTKHDDANSVTESIPPLPQKKRNKQVSKITKASEYSSKDILVLAQAFIQVSENAIEGTAKKSQKFWEEVADSFSKLKEQQEAYDRRLRKKQRYNELHLKGLFLSSNDEEEDVDIVIPQRTASSLQQKWSKFVLPLVTKFVNLTHRYPMKSGEGKSYCLPVIVGIEYLQLNKPFLMC
jgi:hypothetical protein